MAKPSTAQKLDDTQLAKVDAMVDAIKRAPDLRSLHRALMAMVSAGDLAGPVFHRINLLNLPRFDNAKKPDNDGAISWSSTHALVMGEEGLEAARVVERVDNPKPVAVKQPKKQDEVPLAKDKKDDDKEDDADAPQNDGAEDAKDDGEPEAVPPTAEELCALMTAAVEGGGWRIDKLRISVRPSYAGVELEAYKKGKSRSRTFKWTSDLQRGDACKEMLESLVDGLAEG